MDCSPEYDDKWWNEYKIEIRPKDSDQTVVAWVLEKQEEGTTVQFCYGRAGHSHHVYTWFETRNGERDPDWRSDA